MNHSLRRKHNQQLLREVLRRSRSMYSRGASEAMRSYATMEAISFSRTMPQIPHFTSDWLRTITSVKGAVEKVESLNQEESRTHQVLTSPMPGRVISMLVRVGDIVEEGQPLLVMESMKMQNTMFAPKKGRVTQLITEDNIVDTNQLLCVIGEIMKASS